jgi:tetratricopeptide (TPR) repeat protein
MPLSKEEIETLFSKALQTRDRDEKRELCRAILENGTETAFGLFCLAWLLADENPANRQRAIGLYGEALELNPAFWFAHFELGNMLYDSGRYREAAVEYDAALEHGIKAANLFFNAGLAHEKCGDPSRAALYYSRTLEADPEHDGAYFARGSLLVTTRNFEGALSDFNMAVKLRPDNFNYVITRGLAYANLQQFDPAMADFTRAIELNPGDVNPYLYRGNIYLLMNSLDAAIADFAKVIALEPGNAVGYEFLGILYCAKKQFSQGLWCFNKALELNPANTRIMEVMRETRLDQYEPARPAL